MSKRWTVTCSDCKLYPLPHLYCFGASDFETKASQIKKPYTCFCLKTSEKGKNNIDSLGALRNKHKCNDLDDRIKNLRRELTSLVKEESELEAHNKNNDNNSNMNARNGVPISVIKEVHKSYEENVSYSGGQVDVNPNHATHQQMKPDTSSIKQEFTDWLDSTIDSLTETPNSDARESEQTPPRKKNALSSLLGRNAKCILGGHLMSKDWNNLRFAQGLLYQSFVVRNYPSYLIPIDDEVEVLPVNLSKRKRSKTQGRNRLAKKTKTSNKTHTQQRPNPIQQGNSRMVATTYENSSDHEVEVINIDDDDDDDDDDSNDSPTVTYEVDCDEDEPKVIVIDDNEPTPEKEATEEENSGSNKRIWECPICFEQNTGQEVVTTMCGHVFCKKCVEDYYETNDQSCPTCRTDLHNKPLITLFNF